jgi:hypothetical protein
VYKTKAVCGGFLSSAGLYACRKRARSGRSRLSRHFVASPAQADQARYCRAAAPTTANSSEVDNGNVAKMIDMEIPPRFGREAGRCLAWRPPHCFWLSVSKEVEFGCSASGTVRNRGRRSPYRREMRYLSGRVG